MQVLDRGEATTARDLAPGHQQQRTDSLERFRRQQRRDAAVRRPHGAEALEEILAHAEAGVAHAERPKQLVVEHLRVRPSLAARPHAQSRDQRMRQQDRVIDPLARKRLER